jgi:phytoene synthase
VADRASGLTADADTVAAAARAGERDRYLAALLAPAPERAGLLALAAFASEAGRVPSLVKREPAIGEIRLQWWRDALQASDEGVRTGNPIADALRDAMQRHDLPRALLLDVIEARSFDVNGEDMADEAGLQAYLWKSEGALFALAGRILAPEPAASQQAATACGHAYGLARLLLDLPRALAQGRLALPRTRLDAAGVVPQELLAGEGGNKVAGLLADLHAEARRNVALGRQHVADMPRKARVAFLPLALVEPYLRALERPGRDVLRQPADIAPLTRVGRIAVAHWLGRF